MGFFLAILLLLCVSAILSTPLLLFDHLVRFQHRNYKIAWELDGKPNCYFWRIEGFTWERQLVTAKCFTAWVYKTPEWIKSDKIGLKILFWFRFSYYAFIGLWITILVWGISSNHSR